MKYVVLCLAFVVYSSTAVAALLPAPIDIRNNHSQLEVLPPMGFLGCEECQNPYMGGVKGPSKADLELYHEHANIILDGADGFGSGRAGTVKEN